MEGNKRTALFLLGALAAITAGVFCCARTSLAETSSHIIINEIQTDGVDDKNEFIELFNPTDKSIDLGGFKLSKKTKTGSESLLLSSVKFLGTIHAHGYFLIAHPTYKDALSADLAYSGSSYYISNDNTVLLYDKDETLLDKVGFGAAFDFENTPAPNPNSKQSIERNNFADTDNNAADFFPNTSPSPRNSSVVEEYEEELENSGDVPQDEPEKCVTSSKDIRLNEIFPYPQSGNEFVEIANIGETCVDVSGWKIMDEANHKIVFPENSAITPGGYLFLEGNLYFNNDSDTVYLLNADGNTKNEALNNQFYEKAQKDFSFSFDAGTWNWTSMLTPGDDNVIEIPKDSSDDIKTSENYSSAEKVYLNEILPNPKDGSDGEYLEIVNDEGEPVDLYKWTIRDASKTGKYVFEDHTIVEPGKYFVVYRPQFKIALNNGAESVYLYNPTGALVSSASYDKAPQGVSYNFDGQNWKWSKYLTPKKENKFDSPPVVKIKKVKNSYKNLFTEFSVSAKDKETKKLKYTWDFGDGRKSYLAKTSHKYLATGKYRVTLTVRDDSQFVEKRFLVKVKKYPRPDLEILKLLPNPAGKDSEGELVDIRNNSKKKIDLEGWKIATGSASSKIYNHPISEELILNPGETKTVTREFSKFSLNNKAGKVQLVFPDGKIADDVEYEKEKIADDEAYIKLNDEWRWLGANAPKDGAETATDETDDTTDEEETGEEGEVLGVLDENAPVARYKPGFSPEDAYIFLSQINFMKPAKETNYTPMSNPSSSIAYLLSLLI